MKNIIASTELTSVDRVSSIGHGIVFYMIPAFSEFICIINFILCLIYIKKIKQSKILLLISIFSMSIGFATVESRGGGIVESFDINDYIRPIIIITNFIIQIVIFIKLILYIKNKKKSNQNSMKGV